MEVYLHVTDQCNMRCKNCHWFSEPIVVRQSISARDPACFINRILRTGEGVERVIFGGGEPTLWPHLADSVARLPPQVGEVCLFTNGSKPEKLRSIDRPMNVRVSIHDDVNWQKIKELIELAQSKQWTLRFTAFDDSYKEVELPKWFTASVKLKQEQMKAGQEALSHILGRLIYCRPRRAIVGSDGYGYCCEKGVRSKSKAFRSGFSLWDGLPDGEMRACIADKSCLGNIPTEQEIQFIDRMT